MSVKIERLKTIIRQEAAELITSYLNDPRIGFCTVTRVELTNDLSYATIHVSVLGSDAAKRTTMRGLQDARGLIQSHIAHRMKTRTTPHVEIKLDESIERAFHILDTIKAARASDPDHGQNPLPVANAAEDPDKAAPAEAEDAEEGDKDKEEEEDDEEGAAEKDEDDADAEDEQGEAEPDEDEEDEDEPPPKGK